jgi:hypothetical protein
MVQSRVNTDDLAYRPFTRSSVGSFGEPHTEPVAEMVL